MSIGPESAEEVDSNAFSQELALEVLRQAQQRVKAQLDAGNALTSELTAVFGQAVTLSISSFGAAALAFNHTSWVPIWLATGLFSSGLVWSYAAFMALRGLISQESPPRHQDTKTGTQQFRLVTSWCLGGESLTRPPQARLARQGLPMTAPHFATRHDDFSGWQHRWNFTLAPPWAILRNPNRLCRNLSLSCAA
ncbi:MAG TPA: hypothetical protein VMB71_01890 [Acetobacteraceae bacterium]|nr:hypothetical protein [Acetobacteraceae bacterium]